MISGSKSDSRGGWRGDGYYNGELHITVHPGGYENNQPSPSYSGPTGGHRDHDSNGGGSGYGFVSTTPYSYYSSQGPQEHNTDVQSPSQQVSQASAQEMGASISTLAQTTTLFTQSIDSVTHSVTSLQQGVTALQQEGQKLHELLANKIDAIKNALEEKLEAKRALQNQHQAMHVPSQEHIPDTWLMPEKRIVDDIIMEANFLSCPSRLLAQVVSQLCSTTDTSQKVCHVIGQGLQEVVDFVVPPQTKQQLDDMKQELITKWHGRYGYSPEDTRYFLDSVDILAVGFGSSAIGGGIVGGIKVGTKGMLNKLKSMVNISGSQTIHMHVNGRLGYIKFNYTKIHDTLKIYIDKLVAMEEVQDSMGKGWREASIGDKTIWGGFAPRAMRELKAFAQEEKAKEALFQFITGNLHLEEIVKKRFERVGLEQCWDPTRFNKYPVYKIPLPKEATPGSLVSDPLFATVVFGSTEAKDE